MQIKVCGLDAVLRPAHVCRNLGKLFSADVAGLFFLFTSSLLGLEKTVDMLLDVYWA